MHINSLDLLAATLAIQTFANGECPHSLEDGQHVCPDLHQQDGWYGLSHQTSIDSPKGHGALPRMSPFEPLTYPELSTRKWTTESRIMKDRSNWMLCPETFRSIQAQHGPLEIDLFVPRLTKQLRTYVSWRPDPEGDRCILNELERTESLCQPTVEHDLPGLGPSQTTGGDLCVGRPGVENSSTVLPAIDVAHPRALPDPSDRGFDTANPPNQLPKHTAPASRVAYLRAKFSSFLLRLQDYCLPPGGKGQARRTTHCSENGQAGVLNGTLGH